MGGLARWLYSRTRTGGPAASSPMKRLFIQLLTLKPLLSSLSNEAQREMLEESVNLSNPSGRAWYTYLKILYADREIRRVEKRLPACSIRYPLIAKFFKAQLLLFSKRDSSADWLLILDEIGSENRRRFFPIYKEMEREARYQYIVAEAKSNNVERAAAAMIRKPDQPAATFVREAEYVLNAIKNRIRRGESSSQETAMLSEIKDTLSSEIIRRIENRKTKDREFLRFRACAISLWLLPEDGRIDKAKIHIGHLREFSKLHALLPFRKYLERMSELFAEPEAKPNLFMNIRASEHERARFKELLLSKVKERAPFSLVRLGDGESWAFSEYVPEDQKAIYEVDFARRENGWWGGSISVEAAERVRKDVIEAVLQADILGVPELYRLARDVKASGALTYNTRGLLLVQEFVRRNILCRRPGELPVLTDERCNLEIFDKDFLFSAIRECGGAVLIGGFPEEDVTSIRWPWPIRYIRVPPHERTVLHDRNLRGRMPLPLVLDEIERRLADALEPGMLVLIASGIAGKRFCTQAKGSGAMAIDVGSSLDSLLGYN